MRGFLWVDMLVSYIIGGVAILCGVTLFFVKIDKEDLRSKSHTNPGMALFRFPLWRYGQAVVCILFGILWIAVAENWIVLN